MSLDQWVIILNSEPASKLADLMHRLAGPAFDELGEYFGQQVREWRINNAVEIFKRVQKRLNAAGLPPKSIPPRLFLPLVEAASAEDDETLQEMWAGLLTSASQDSETISASFVQTLKQLNPREARFLVELIRSYGAQRFQWEPRSVNPFRFRGKDVPPTALDTFERLGLLRRDFGITRGESGREEPDVGYQFILTDYAINFLAACQGPHPAKGTA